MKRTPVLHPFFFAAFPILALYAHNIRSLPVPLKELAGPLGLSVAGSLVLSAAIRALVRDPIKAGFLVTTIFLWVLSFGHLANIVSAWTGGMYLRSLFFATALLAGVFSWRIVRSRRDGQALTRILNVVSVGLVLVNSAAAGRTLIQRPLPAASDAIRASGPATARPDIYYLVFDAYARADILQEVFRFDNTPFLAALESRGFRVASESLANYGLTYHSLASSLNMTYLDSLAEKIGQGSSNQEPLYRMIRDNAVMAFLKSRGYELIVYTSGIKRGDLRGVDRWLGYEMSTSEFLTAFWNTTPIPLFIRLGSDRAAYRAHRRHVLDAFRALEDPPSGEGPFFYFVHLMSPHPPFVFDSSGAPVEPDHLFSLVDADRLHGGVDAAVNDYLAGYREQLAFLNLKILEAVDAILARSAAPPVIVIQGDHGSRALADLDRPEATYLKESLGILNAFLLPGDGPSPVYPRVSPVNTFRMVFKRYFGADTELLDDRAAWCTWQHPFKFIPFDENDSLSTAESARAHKRPKAPIVRTR